MSVPVPAAARRTLTVTGLPGGDLAVPYAEVQGDADGPHLVLLAGVHGAEYASMAAVRRFSAALDPAALAGRVTAVPVLNLPAFWARSAFVVPADGRNLNRSFPGDPGGSYAERLAHAAFEHFVRGADALVDLHAGDLPEALEPFTIYDESPVEDAAAGMARAYGLGHVVRQASAARTVGGSTSAAAADVGVPAITAESGQNGLVQADAVERHLRGLAGVLHHLGMTKGPAPQPPAPPVLHEGWHWLRTPVQGWWEPAVSTGQAVRGGQLLGTVSDLLGEVLHEVHAPEDGVPLFVTSSPAVLDDGLLLGLARGLA